MVMFARNHITPDSALGGTQIQKSVKFNSADTSYLKRTVTSEGNRVKWTWSGWAKRVKLGTTTYGLLTSPNGGDGGGNNGIGSIYWSSDDKIHVYYDTTGANNSGAINDIVYRDIGSWYHIVWQVDAANSTSKIWVNGVEQTVNVQPVSGYNYTMNQNGYQMTMGIDAWDLYSPADNYLAEIHFSDGQLYAASDFGYTDAQTGQWRPKSGNVVKSNITYGTNGFWLDFRDSTSTTTLGYDYSGNGNHWTPHNMSVAAGSGNDCLDDTPTNNFVTLNPLKRFTHNCTLSDGNLKATGSSESYPGAAADIELTSGKWYYEFKITSKTSNPICGVCQNNYVSGGTGRIMYRADGVYIMSNSSEPTDPDTFGVGDIIGVAIDLDHGDGLIRFYKNGTLQTVNSGLNNVKSNLSISTLGGLLPYIQMYTGDACAVNFGQQTFVHTPPTGHRALSSHNLATVNAAEIVRPQRHFDTILYQGDGSSSKTVSGLEFKPDLVWMKGRTNMNHYIVDSVRGRASALFPNSDSVEQTSSSSQDLVEFNQHGFVVGTPYRASSSNNNGTNIVAWCWKAGGNSSTYNIDGTGYGTASAAGLDGGSINPTGASVNTESGFGIYTYTGTGSNATIAHGLGTKPAWILVKNRNATSGSTENWTVYHQRNTDNPETEYLTLNGTSATADLNSIWNDTEPTSSLISIGTHARVNESASVNYIMYVWSEIPGFSKFGTYTGNGSSNGPYIHLGFRPAWFMQKKTSGTGGWYIFDSKRSGSNVDNDILVADVSDAEYDGASYPRLDFLANGIKWRDAGSSVHNQTSATYIYMAFAERPSGTIFGLDANSR